MKVRVTRLWRDGIQVPRWQLSQVEVVTGELRIQECRDEHLRRYLRIAHLFDFDRSGDNINVIPPLIDAAVLYAKDNSMSISGFERGDMTPTVAQTWLVEVLATDSVVRTCSKPT